MKFEEHTVNGLRVAVMPQRSSLFHASLMVCSGAVDDGNSLGLSHLTEHCVMCPLATAHGYQHPLFSVLDDYGIRTGGTTFLGKTIYFAEGSATHAQQAIESLLEAVFYFAIEEGAVLREQRVVGQELQQDNQTEIDDWLPTQQALLPEIALNMAYTGGTKETLAVLTPKDVYDFRHGHYVPENCQLAVVGGVTPEAVAAIVDRIVTPTTRKPFVARHIVPRRGDFEVSATVTSRLLHIFAYPENEAACNATINCLISSPHGAMTKILRLEESVVYDFSYDHFYPPVDAALLMTPTATRHLQHVDKTFHTELEKLAQAGPSRALLATIKNHFQTSWHFTREYRLPEGWANMIHTLALRGKKRRRDDDETFYHTIGTLSPDTIKETAAWMRDNLIATVAVVCTE